MVLVKVQGLCVHNLIFEGTKSDLWEEKGAAEAGGYNYNDQSWNDIAGAQWARRVSF
jgi:hypothetical protein